MSASASPKRSTPLIKFSFSSATLVGKRNLASSCQSPSGSDLEKSPQFLDMEMHITTKEKERSDRYRTPAFFSREMPILSPEPGQPTHSWAHYRCTIHFDQVSDSLNLRAIWQLHFLRHAAHSQANLSPRVPQLGTFTTPSFTSFCAKTSIISVSATRAAFAEYETERCGNEDDADHFRIFPSFCFRNRPGVDLKNWLYMVGAIPTNGTNWMR
jgi:hypothetical protein